VGTLLAVWLGGYALSRLTLSQLSTVTLGAFSQFLALALGVTWAVLSSFFGFHDLRHTCITKLAEGQASEQTLMSIAGHLSRKMLEHYSHIRMAAKRAALEAISTPVFVGDVVQNPLQSPTDENAALPN
jgi:integrase